MNKLVATIIILIILAVIAVVIINLQAPAPAEVQLSDDTTAEITQDLESLELRNLDQEFQAIDAELQQL